MRADNRPILAFSLLATVLCATTGCLSLGGTTYSGESAETEGRLSSLEARISTLEQATLGHAVSSAMPAGKVYAADSIPAPNWNGP